jgi:RNA polymerase sigma-70 factor (ECF subfamily)
MQAYQASVSLAGELEIELEIAWPAIDDERGRRSRARGAMLNLPSMSRRAAPPAVGAGDHDLEHIFAALAAGEAGALADLYARCGADLFGLALWRTGSRDDAADVVQDVFVKVMADPSRLAAVRRPRAWLLAVAHRCAVDLVRGRRDREASVLDHLVLPVAEDPGRRVDGERLSALLHRLPAAQREALYLRHFAELSFRDIGRITGVSTFTAATRYRLGLERLRRRLGVAR